MQPVMALLLFVVKKANRWYRDEVAERWLASGDVPADPIGDLRTTENQLSVWEVAQDRSTVHRIVTAVASGADEPSPRSYVLFDSGLLPQIGIATSDQERGKTADREA